MNASNFVTDDLQSFWVDPAKSRRYDVNRPVEGSCLCEDGKFTVIELDAR